VLLGLLVLASCGSRRGVDVGGDASTSSDAEVGSAGTGTGQVDDEADSESESVGESESDGESESVGESESAGETESAGDSDSESGEPPPVCGDALVEGDEACDLGPGNAWENADCQPDCTANLCGDGFVGPGERCDDGNLVGVDLCSADCRHPLVDCGQYVHNCGNTLDDDGDGLIDLDDPECLSACGDFNEAFFATDRPSQNDDKNDTDCWWDDNEGSGDDLCGHDYQCDPLSPAAPPYPYNPDMLPWCFPPTQACIDSCGPLTPNGCDCNGCCLIDGESRFLGIWVGEYETGCSHWDFASCNPCTIEPTCFNPCEPDSCELCFPDGIEMLEPGCEAPVCPLGVTPCADPYACGEDERCRGGCCLPADVL
jgi:cysteine-rich repeat protein